MKAKEYLLQVRKYDRIIENKLAEKRLWEKKAMSYGVSLSTEERVQSSGSKQKMADAVCEYVDIEMEDIAGLKKARGEIIATIELLSVNEYDLLHMVYVQHKTINDVAGALDKTYSWCTTIHGRALQHVQEIIDRRGI